MAPQQADRRGTIVRVLGFWVLPAIALLLALGAGYFKYQEATADDADRARVQTAQVATEATVAMLSYTPDTATEKLKAARERLTGPFRDSYTSLTDDVVIPGAQQKRISATAKVSGAASVSASGNHAVVMVFVDQTTVVGNDAPTDTDSVVQVTLDKNRKPLADIGFRAEMSSIPDAAAADREPQEACEEQP